MNLTVLALRDIAMNAVASYGIQFSEDLPTTLWAELQVKKYRFWSTIAQTGIYADAPRWIGITIGWWAGEWRLLMLPSQRLPNQRAVIQPGQKTHLSDPWSKIFLPEQGCDIVVKGFQVDLDAKTVTFNGEYTSASNLTRLRNFDIYFFDPEARGRGTVRAKFRTTFTFDNPCTDSRYMKIKTEVEIDPKPQAKELNIHGRYFTEQREFINFPDQNSL